MISLQHITKTYDTAAGAFYALRDLNLEIQRGEFVGLIGKSGSGKSTLLNIVGGIDQATSGAATVNGIAIESLSQTKLAQWRGRTIGFVFQFFQLLPTLTAAENVMLPMDFCRTYPGDERRKRALALLEQVGVTAQADKLPTMLSGGEQQRVAIARALAMHPEILMFDEPTSALDPKRTASLRTLLRGFVEQGHTMVIVSHSIGFLEGLADQVLYMEGGEVVESGDADQILNSPGDPRTQDFIAQAR